jgi:hypothetical protein
MARRVKARALQGERGSRVALIAGLVLRLVRHPSLAVAAISQALRLVPRHPFRLAEARRALMTWVAWRLHTAYGTDLRRGPSAEELADYLAWCRDLPRWRRGEW